jgi:enamine deaminase RidA (YjgF/YER057c/UK114 family)
MKVPVVSDRHLFAVRPGAGKPLGVRRPGEETRGMSAKITRINPPELHTTPGYHHITVVTAGRTAYLAGQCPLDADGRLVGEGDHRAQAGQVAANALTALAAAGAGPQDVVRSVIYVVSDEQPVLSAVWEALNASPLGPAFGTASTLLGVARLGFTGQLVELDLTAALAEPTA